MKYYKLKKGTILKCPVIIDVRLGKKKEVKK